MFFTNLLSSIRSKCPRHIILLFLYIIYQWVGAWDHPWFFNTSFPSESEETLSIIYTVQFSHAFIDHFSIMTHSRMWRVSLPRFCRFSFFGVEWYTIRLHDVTPHSTSDHCHNDSSLHIHPCLHCRLHLNMKSKYLIKTQFFRGVSSHLLAGLRYSCRSDIIFSLWSWLVTVSSKFCTSLNFLQTLV